jgi:hypothetical protein
LRLLFVLEELPPALAEPERERYPADQPEPLPTDSALAADEDPADDDPAAVQVHPTARTVGGAGSWRGAGAGRGRGGEMDVSNCVSAGIYASGRRARMLCRAMNSVASRVKSSRRRVAVRDSRSLRIAMWISSSSGSPPATAACAAAAAAAVVAGGVAGECGAVVVGVGRCWREASSVLREAWQKAR